MSSKCLNCEAELHGKYCHNCGQKASTHRISFSTFIKHDLLHGVLHLDKGIIYTIKSLIYKPGYAAANFIKGKRIVHYNIFALFIIVIAVKTIIDAQLSPNVVFNSYQSQEKQADEFLNGLIKHYYKVFYLLSIPLLSIFSFMLLRKLRFNFIEHVVFNCFFLTGSFFYALVFTLIAELTSIKYADLIGAHLIGIYLLICFYQITKQHYKWYGFLWRTLLVLVLFLAMLMAILILIILVFYGGSFNGAIQI